MKKANAVFAGAIVFYFVIALEVLIMISPFAGFFYSVFNPFLLRIAKYPATEWLTAFFLPHMVVPPDNFLIFIRVMGSVLFVAGIAAFGGCAVQVYGNKIFRRGVAVKGFYSVIRHPQYAALCGAGLGLSILWPRFLTLGLWVVMTFVYYFLARDEERRMLKNFPDTYGKYMGKTGMFLPRKIERALAPSGLIGKAGLFVLIAIVTVGVAFSLRYYTIRHLPLWTDSNVVVLSILPEDLFKMEHRMAEILRMPEIKSRIRQDEKYLVYFLSPDYIMQGMIANSGSEWMLYRKNHSIGLIMDWIFNPFGHLRGAHHTIRTGIHTQNMGRFAGNAVSRRLIFISVRGAALKSPFDLFAINARRMPQFMADLDVHNLRMIDIRDLPAGSGWGSVPTPLF